MSTEAVREEWRERRTQALSALRSHPALAVTGAYLFLTAVGLLYSSLFFRQLGIRFSDYAQPEDLLMAALKEPLLIALLLGTLVLGYLLFQFDLWLRARFARYDALFSIGWVERLTYHPALWGAVLLIYAFAFTSIYAGEAAQAAQEGERQRVVVELRTGAAEPERLQRTLLETTSSFLLVYDAGTEEARAIPYNSIVSLVMPSEGAATGEETPAAAAASEQER